MMFYNAIASCTEHSGCARLKYARSFRKHSYIIQNENAHCNIKTYTLSICMQEPFLEDKQHRNVSVIWWAHSAWQYNAKTYTARASDFMPTEIH